MKNWKELKPGDRVESVTGAKGTVMHLIVPLTRQGWVRVKWDSGYESRMIPDELKENA